MSIGFQGKRHYLGSFSDYNEAVQARRGAEKELHENFIRVYEWWNGKSLANAGWAEDNPLVFEVQKKDKELYVSSPFFAEMEKEREEKLAEESGFFMQADSCIMQNLG